MKPKRGRPFMPPALRFKRVLITLDPEAYSLSRKVGNLSAWVAEQLRKLKSPL